jgi:hypothetical protein
MYRLEQLKADAALALLIAGLIVIALLIVTLVLFAVSRPSFA